MHYTVYCLEQNHFNSTVISNFKNIKGYINTEYVGFSGENIWESKCNIKKKQETRGNSRYSFYLSISFNMH